MSQTWVWKYSAHRKVTILLLSVSKRKQFSSLDKSLHSVFFDGILGQKLLTLITGMCDGSRQSRMGLPEKEAEEQETVCHVLFPPQYKRLFCYLFD